MVIAQSWAGLLVTLVVAVSVVAIVAKLALYAIRSGRDVQFEMKFPLRLTFRVSGPIRRRRH